MSFLTKTCKRPCYSAGVGTLCDESHLKINLNLRGSSFSHGSGALKSCTLMVKLRLLVLVGWSVGNLLKVSTFARHTRCGRYPDLRSAAEQHKDQRMTF